MARAKGGFKARRRRNKVLKMAKGFRGSRSKRFSVALHVVRRSLAFAFRDRRRKKRDFRRLWIQRINAACRSNGMSYSKFIGALKKASIRLDRSVLADLALREPSTFVSVVNSLKQ